MGLLDWSGPPNSISFWAASLWQVESKLGQLCIKTFINHVGPSWRVTRVEEDLVGSSRI